MPHAAGLCWPERTGIVPVLGGTVAAGTCHSKWHEWLTWHRTRKAEQPFVSRDVQESTADLVLNYCIAWIHPNFKLLSLSRENNLCPQILAWTWTCSRKPSLPSVLPSRRRLCSTGKAQLSLAPACVIHCIPCLFCGLHCTTQFPVDFTAHHLLGAAAADRHLCWCF